MILTVLSFARAFFRHTNTKTFKIRDGPLEDDGPHCLPFPFEQSDIWLCLDTDVKGQSIRFLSRAEYFAYLFAVME